MKILEVLFGLFQRVFRGLDVSLVRDPFPLSRRSVPLPDRPLVLSVRKVRLCLLNCENFFLQRQLVVLRLLLPLERVELRVQRGQLRIPRILLGAERILHRILQLRKQVVHALRLLFDLFLPVVPFRGKVVDVCLTGSDGAHIIRLRGKRVLNFAHFGLLRVLTGSLLFQQRQLGFQQRHALLVRCQPRIRGASATTGSGTLGTGAAGLVPRTFAVIKGVVNPLKKLLFALFIASDLSGLHPSLDGSVRVGGFDPADRCNGSRRCTRRASKRNDLRDLRGKIESRFVELDNFQSQVVKRFSGVSGVFRNIEQ